MSNAISKRNRISLVADFTERFAALLPFATHDVCEDDVDAGTDEQRIAYLMGWYLRAIQVAGVPSLLQNLVVKQVEHRVEMLGPNVHPDEAAKFATRQTGGGRMGAGQCLIAGELEEDTLFRMWSRIKSVHEWLEKAVELDYIDKEYKLFRYVPMANDEALIDLYLYFAVQAAEGDGLAPELGPEPVGVHDMLVDFSRQLRADSVEWHDEDGEPLDPSEVDDLNSYHPGEYEAYAAVRKLIAGYIPPLNSDTEMFRRRNHIAVDDAFWTDARIAAAVALGMK